MDSPRFNWGDTVRVKPCASVEMRAGECGAVIAITEIDTQAKANNYDVPVGSIVYQVEFGDGGAAEIGEAWLESTDE